MKQVLIIVCWAIAFVVSFFTPHHFGFYFVLLWLIGTLIFDELKKELSECIEGLREEIHGHPSKVRISVCANWDKLYPLLRNKNLDPHKAFFVKGIFDEKDQIEQGEQESFSFQVIHVCKELSLSNKILSYDTMHNNIWFEDFPEDGCIFTFYVFDESGEIALCQSFSLFDFSNRKSNIIDFWLSSIIDKMFNTIKHVKWLKSKEGYKYNIEDYTCEFDKYDLGKNFKILSNNCYHSKFENDFITIDIDISEG